MDITWLEEETERLLRRHCGRTPWSIQRLLPDGRMFVTYAGKVGAELHIGPATIRVILPDNDDEPRNRARARHYIRKCIRATLKNNERRAH